MNMVRKCVKHCGIMEGEAFRQARCRIEQTAGACNVRSSKDPFSTKSCRGLGIRLIVYHAAVVQL